MDVKYWKFWTNDFQWYSGEEFFCLDHSDPRVEVTNVVLIREGRDGWNNHQVDGRALGRIRKTQVGACATSDSAFPTLPSAKTQAENAGWTIGPEQSGDPGPRGWLRRRGHRVSNT